MKVLLDYFVIRSLFCVQSLFSLGNTDFENWVVCAAKIYFLIAILHVLVLIHLVYLVHTWTSRLSWRGISWKIGAFCNEW